MEFPDTALTDNKQISVLISCVDILTLTVTTGCATYRYQRFDIKLHESGRL